MSDIYKKRSNTPKHKPQLRADAAWAVFEILEQGRSSRDVMPLIFERHYKAKDRAWLQETVFGVLRYLPSLQHWLRQLLDKPLKKQQKLIESLLMVGFFQQAFMRTSSHAAVSETVEASKVLKHPNLSALVNAILRNFDRDEIAQAPIESPHAQFNLPKWLYKRINQHYPDTIGKIAQAMLAKAPIYLRVNTLVTTFEGYSALLSEADVDFELCTLQTKHLHTQAIKIRGIGDITALPGFNEGMFAVQDFAAQQASALLGASTGDRVLDACAAPGGKTAALIENCPDIEQLIALDSEASRNTRTLENLQRLGHMERLGERLKIVNADASLASTFDKMALFDKILLDAPCSATGVIRRHPDIKWHRKSADIDELVILQNAILAQCWQALKPGGILLYATCSILPEENSLQIKRFLENHSDAKLIAINKNESAEQPGWQILPGEHDMDGFFYARLLKSA